VNVPTSPERELVRPDPTLPRPIREWRGRAPAGASPTAVGRFQNRARLYGALDLRLRSKTRFFGAACITNRVLGHLASSRVGIPHTGMCADWLSELGTSLETVNRSLAEAVHTGHLVGPALDQRIVSIEQSAVEQSLERARTSGTSAYLRVLPLLDALLNHRSLISTLHFSSAVRWYRRVLAQVRDDLRSPIEFARQAHREKIGLALISALQREG
jgi:hypothetical protein